MKTLHLLPSCRRPMHHLAVRVLILGVILVPFPIVIGPHHCHHCHHCMLARNHLPCALFHYCQPYISFPCAPVRSLFSLVPPSTLKDTISLRQGVSGLRLSSANTCKPTLVWSARHSPVSSVQPSLQGTCCKNSCGTCGSFRGVDSPGDPASRRPHLFPDILRRAPLLSSPTEEQFPAVLNCGSSIHYGADHVASEHSFCKLLSLLSSNLHDLPLDLTMVTSRGDLHRLQAFDTASSYQKGSNRKERFTAMRVEGEEYLAS